MADINFDQLRALSTKLNEASDALSEQIVQLESVLNGLKLGVTAWVEIRRQTEEMESGQFINYFQMLGYGKHNGKWGLLYSDGYDEFPENESTAFLREAPRVERIAAVDKIPALIRQLETNAANVAARASEKTAELSGLVADLKPPAK